MAACHQRADRKVCKAALARPFLAPYISHLCPLLLCVLVVLCLALRSCRLWYTVQYSKQHRGYQLGNTLVAQSWPIISGHVMARFSISTLWNAKTWNNTGIIGNLKRIIGSFWGIEEWNNKWCFNHNLPGPSHDWAHHCGGVGGLVCTLRRSACSEL